MRTKQTTLRRNFRRRRVQSSSLSRGENLLLGEFTLWDLGRKRLVIHKVTYATATVRRLVKYTKQGFTSCAGVAQEILKAVAADPSLIHSEVEYVD